MADDGNPLAGPGQDPANPPAGLALSTPRPGGSHRYHRFGRRDEGRVSRQREGGSTSDGASGEVHHVFVRDVRVGEQHEIHAQVIDECLEPVLRVNRDTVGVTGPRQLRRVAAIVDVGNLGGGEADDLEIRIGTKERVEVVEVTPGCAEDQHAHWHRSGSCLPAPGPYRALRRKVAADQSCWR